MLKVNKELVRSLVAQSRKAGGAHATLHARDQTYSDFAAAMRAANVQIKSAAQIGGKEMNLYATYLKGKVKSVGTQQNRMAAIRVALRQVNKASLADDPNYSNKALGLGDRCRDGTKTAADPEVFAAVKAKLVELDREWMANSLDLSESIGLRRAEAVCVPSFRLKKWLEQLKKDGRVDVKDATKGGRPRFVEPPDFESAQNAIQAALKLAEANGGYLGQYKDGSPAKSKKSALNMYSSCLNRSGFQGHSLRYTFTRASRDKGLEEGMTDKQAKSHAACNLGHGAGRDRYVNQVYLK